MHWFNVRATQFVNKALVQRSSILFKIDCNTVHPSNRESEKESGRGWFWCTEHTANSIEHRAHQQCSTVQRLSSTVQRERGRPFDNGFNGRKRVEAAEALYVLPEPPTLLPFHLDQIQTLETDLKSSIKGHQIFGQVQNPPPAFARIVLFADISHVKPCLALIHKTC